MRKSEKKENVSVAPDENEIVTPVVVDPSTASEIPDTDMPIAERKTQRRSRPPKSLSL